MHTIQTKEIQITINDNPLELTSVQYKKKEYTYQLDGDWQKQNPICFPITGRLINNEYWYNGQKYSMPIHGFFRDIKNWKIIQKTTNTIVFEFIHHQEFKDQYPFAFTLQVKYEIHDDEFINQVTIINNETTQDLPYCFGWHPSFIIDPPTAKISFNKPQVLTTIPSDNWFKKNMVSTTINEFIPNHMDYSKGQSYDLLNHNLTEVILTDNTREIKITVQNYPNLVFWKINDQAKFICIEPWDGHQDYEDSGQVDIFAKPWINKLQPGHQKEYILKIKFIK
ncbi:hypothetical protein [Spiroplasma eriocheiris]|uniref:Aldose 1-epimerase family protein n=1 Tax=Spiroplasma eriocheiris TaxID=315358 RepID=A0A0H3XKB6_9MOLU|nr:hypothetical protein [Spiroplasma eriocheiris]AHF57368.1 putative aldose 1-epimerase [Spiroplasma eriocheiris CCTCC M 207170]AKM53824.1 aldose 1-epimerase family protein [Spiroplasma eriocheiris]